MQSKCFKCHAFLACALLSFPTSLLLAQFDSGTVLGTIHDPSGASEAFNLLNHTNFSPGGLSLTTNGSSYGIFTSTFPARQLQLALKLFF